MHQSLSAIPAVYEVAVELVKGLETSWQMIEEALTRESIADLAQTYPLPYKENHSLITRQWVIWHVLSHDIHHGGELTLMLGMQAIPLPELGDEGGLLNARLWLNRKAEVFALSGKKGELLNPLLMFLERSARASSNLHEVV